MSETTFAEVAAAAEAEVTAEAKPAEVTSLSKGGAPRAMALAATGAAGNSEASENYSVNHLQVLGKSSQFEVAGANIGDVCLDKEHAIAPLGELLNCVIVSAYKYWKEDVPFGTKGVMPRFAHTVEERKAIEDTTDFKGTVPVCDITVLLQRPSSFTDDDLASSLFIYEFGGEEFALVKYTVQKAQAVRDNYGTINSSVDAHRIKGEDAAEYQFQLYSKEKGQGTPYAWHAFVLRSTNTRANEEAVSFARAIRGEQ